MGVRKEKPQAPRKMAAAIQADVRQRLRLYVARTEVKIKDVFNEALDEYLKKRGA